MLTYEAIKDIVDIVVPPGTFNTVELEPEFAKKVRSTNVILKSNNPFSYEDIRRAAGDCYFQVALRISTAKYVNSRNDFQWTEEDILAMMTPAGQGASLSPITRLGSFSGGIEWAVVRLAAATLSKNIPLNTSNLKFVEAAKDFESQANEDVERIIQLIASSSATNNSIDNEVTKGQAYLYIAHDINRLTLPESYFNFPDIGSLAPNLTYDSSVDIEKLRKTVPPVIPATTEIEVVDTFSVPPGKMGICYFYMTGQAKYADQDLLISRNTTQGIGEGQNSKSVSYKIERVFKVVSNGETKNIDDLITSLSDYINSEALNALNDLNDANDPYLLTNVLTAPNRGENKLASESVLKRELYPTTTLLKNRKADFKLYRRINSLTFDVRRYSNKASTELLTIGFYTVDDTLFSGDSSSVTVPIRQGIKNGELGIEGLIFGSVNSYSSLNNKVPYSALLNVEKGNVTAVSIAGENSGGGTNPTDNLANSDASNTIDTFYFAYKKPDPLQPFTQPFTQNLILRVSSTTYTAENPLDIIVDLTVEPFTDPNISESLSIGEQVANRVVDAIYNYTRTSALSADTKDNANILGVLLGDYQRVTTVINSTTSTASEIPLEEFIDGIPQTRFTGAQTLDSYDRDERAGRVQIIAFRYRDEEYKIVVDLIQVPSNLWVGTGNYILRRTQWGEGRRRSITADTKVLSSGNTMIQTKAEELNSVKASVSNIEASKSKLLQSVFDKRKFLNDAQKGFINKWQYPT